MMSEAFKKANQLWFREGRTGSAVTAYEQALQETPDDPVLAFQLARVMWSIDRFERARSLVQQATKNKEKLSTGGQRVLETWAAQLQQQPPERSYPELTPALLDRDELERGPLEDWDWRTIADAAAFRKMFGLAAYAIEQWEGAPFDGEDARDIDDIETNRAMEQNMLVQMYAQYEPPAQPSTMELPELDTPKSNGVYEDHAVVSSIEVAPPTVTPKRSVETTHSDLPMIPLLLTVNVSPSEGPVGVATTMEASLSNPTDESYAVNRRMLLNHVNSPGEIWLDVEGPEGYRNQRGFRIRVGKASDEFFITLAPGESVEQSWDLDDYQSLHVPGDYKITLTYHNEDREAPDGRPLTIGKVVGSIQIRRY